MKTWLIKTLASAALKNAIAYAAVAASLAGDALQGVLDSGYLDDRARLRITTVLKVLISIEGFLIKFRTLLGAEIVPLSSTSSIVLDDIADRLSRATERL